MLFLQSAIAALIAALGMKPSARATANQPFMQYKEPPPADPVILVQTLERQANDRFKAMVQSHISG